MQMHAQSRGETPISPVAIATPVRDKQRRNEARLAHREPCKVRVLDADNPDPCVGVTVNVSQYGLAVQIARSIPTGTAVEALVPHLFGEPRLVCGRVTHTRRVLADLYEIGITLEPERPSNPRSIQ